MDDNVKKIIKELRDSIAAYRDSYVSGHEELQSSNSSISATNDEVREMETRKQELLAARAEIDNRIAEEEEKINHVNDIISNLSVNADPNAEENLLPSADSSIENIKSLQEERLNITSELYALDREIAKNAHRNGNLGAERQQIIEKMNEEYKKHVDSIANFEDLLETKVNELDEKITQFNAAIELITSEDRIVDDIKLRVSQLESLKNLLDNVISKGIIAAYANSFKGINKNASEQDEILGNASIDDIEEILNIIDSVDYNNMEDVVDKLTKIDQRVDDKYDKVSIVTNENEYRYTYKHANGKGRVSGNNLDDIKKDIIYHKLGLNAPEEELEKLNDLVIRFDVDGVKSSIKFSELEDYLLQFKKQDDKSTDKLDENIKDNNNDNEPNVDSEEYDELPSPAINNKNTQPLIFVDTRYNRFMYKGVGKEGKWFDSLDELKQEIMLDCLGKIESITPEEEDKLFNTLVSIKVGNKATEEILYGGLDEYIAMLDKLRNNIDHDSKDGNVDSEEYDELPSPAINNKNTQPVIFVDTTYNRFMYKGVGKEGKWFDSLDELKQEIMLDCLGKKESLTPEEEYNLFNTLVSIKVDNNATEEILYGRLDEYLAIFDKSSKNNKQEVKKDSDEFTINDIKLSDIFRISGYDVLSFDKIKEYNEKYEVINDGNKYTVKDEKGEIVTNLDIIRNAVFANLWIKSTPKVTKGKRTKKGNEEETYKTVLDAISVAAEKGKIDKASILEAMTKKNLTSEEMIRTLFAESNPFMLEFMSNYFKNSSIYTVLNNNIDKDTEEKNTKKDVPYDELTAAVAEKRLAIMKSKSASKGLLLNAIAGGGGALLGGAIAGPVGAYLGAALGTTAGATFSNHGASLVNLVPLVQAKAIMYKLNVIARVYGLKLNNDDLTFTIKKGKDKGKVVTSEYLASNEVKARFIPDRPLASAMYMGLTLQEALDQAFYNEDRLMKPVDEKMFGEFTGVYKGDEALTPVTVDNLYAAFQHLGGYSTDMIGYYTNFATSKNIKQFEDKFEVHNSTVKKDAEGNVIAEGEAVPRYNESDVMQVPDKEDESKIVPAREEKRLEDGTIETTVKLNDGSTIVETTYRDIDKEAVENAKKYMTAELSGELPNASNEEVNEPEVKSEEKNEQEVKIEEKNETEVKQEKVKTTKEHNDDFFSSPEFENKVIENGENAAKSNNSEEPKTEDESLSSTLSEEDNLNKIQETEDALVDYTDFVNKLTGAESTIDYDIEDFVDSEEWEQAWKDQYITEEKGHSKK